MPTYAAFVPDDLDAVAYLLRHGFGISREDLLRHRGLLGDEAFRVLRRDGQPAAFAAVWTMDQWFQRAAGTHPQQSDPLGGIHFVTRDRNQIDVQLINKHRQLADRLGSVQMQRNLIAMTDIGNGADRLDRPGVDCGMRHTDQRRLRPQHRFDG